jgi:ribonuclease Z
LGTFTVQILGTSSATPAFSRFPSAQVVNYNDRYYLIDCGEGTQMQFLRYGIRYARLDAIFISHLHGDHILGLPGMLASMSMLERTEMLPIYAPRALKEIIDTVFRLSESYIKYELQFHALEDFEPGEVIFQTEKLSVTSIPLDHRTWCRGFIFREINKKRKFNFHAAKQLEVPREYFHLLKQGNDITLPDDRVIQSDYVLFHPEPPLSYAYCSDTRYNEDLVNWLQDITLLYHEATFTEHFAKRAAETYHSTARQAGRIASMVQPRMLVIGHYSARYRDLQPLLTEALEAFPYTELALEGRVFNVKEMMGEEAAQHTQEQEGEHEAPAGEQEAADV